jgi:hypothetical protein
MYADNRPVIAIDPVGEEWWWKQAPTDLEWRPEPGKPIPDREEYVHFMLQHNADFGSPVYYALQSAYIRMSKSGRSPEQLIYDFNVMLYGKREWESYAIDVTAEGLTDIGLGLVSAPLEPALRVIDVASLSQDWLSGGQSSLYSATGQQVELSLRSGASLSQVYRQVGIQSLEELAWTMAYARLLRLEAQYRPRPSAAPSAARISSAPTPVQQKNYVRGLFTAKDFGQELRNQGYVIYEEITVNTPFGQRRYDIVIRTPQGRYHAVEVKKGGAARNRHQRYSDDYVNRYGATVVGRKAQRLRIKGVEIESVTSISFGGF